MVFEGEKLMAVLPANRVGDALISHQGLTYGGLVLKPKNRLAQVIIFYKGILEFLQQEGIAQLQIKDIPGFYHKVPSGEMEYIFYLTQAKLIKTEVAAVIDNRNRLPLHRSRQGGLKKAARAQLNIMENTDFEAFWDEILIPNLKRQHQAHPTHTVDEISLLATRFPNNIRQFNVYEDEQIVAGATIFETDTVAHVQYISANARRQELGSLDFLFKHLIFDVFREKHYFDLGTSNESNGLKLNAGLQNWKESLGARSFAKHTYRVNTKNASNLENILL